MAEDNDYGRNNSLKPFFKRATIAYLRYREWELDLFGRGLEKFGALIPAADPLVRVIAPLAGKIMQPFGRAAGQIADALERDERPDYKSIATGILNDEKANEALLAALDKGAAAGDKKALITGNKPSINA